MARCGGVIAPTPVVFSDVWLGVLSAVDVVKINAIKLNNLR